MSRLLFAAFVIASLGSAQDAPALVWIRQQAKAEAAGLELNLGDVAQVDGVDAKAAVAIRNIRLLDLPANGRTLVISRDSLTEAVRAADVGRATIEWDGAQSTQVSLKTISLSGEQVASLGRQFVARSLGDKASDAKFGAAPLPEPFLCVAGRWSTRVFVRTKEQGALCGVVRLEIVCLSDGQERRAMPFVMDVCRRGRVLVAAHDLQPGQTLRSDDITTNEQDLSTVGMGALDSPDRAAGLVLARRVAAGQALTSRDFRARPVVERGDAVTIRIRIGGLRVTALGRTMAAGAPGERIPVTNVTSNKLIHATVVDSRTVDVSAPAESPEVNP